MGFGTWLTNTVNDVGHAVGIGKGSPFNTDPGQRAGYGQQQGNQDFVYSQGQSVNAQGRGPIQASSLNSDAAYNRADDAIGNEQDALGLMRGAAMGTVPSAAAGQMQAGTDQAIHNEMAIAAGARGGGMAAAAAQRQAANTGASLMQGNVQQSAILRAQEQATGRAMYGQQANAIRQQHLDEAQQRGQFALGQGQLALGSQGQNDAAALGWYGQGMGAHQLAQQGDIANQGAESAANAANAAGNRSMLMGAVQAGAGLAAMSDERVKGVVRSLSMGDMMDAYRAGSGGAGGAAQPSQQDVSAIAAGQSIANMAKSLQQKGKGGGAAPTSPDGSGMGNQGYMGQSADAAPGAASMSPGSASENGEGFAFSGGAQGDMGAAGAGGGGAMLAEESDEREKEHISWLARIGDGMRDLAGVQRKPELRDAPLQSARGGVAADAGARGESFVKHAAVDRRLQLAGFGPWYRGSGNGGADAADEVSDRRDKRIDAELGQAERHAEPALFMDHLRPAAFHYKPGVGEDPRAERYGVMAQDVEKTPMGASFVTETPIGKQLDIKHGFGAVLASLANLNDRLRAQEERKAG